MTEVAQKSASTVLLSGALISFGALFKDSSAKDGLLNAMGVAEKDGNIGKIVLITMGLLPVIGWFINSHFLQEGMRFDEHKKIVLTTSILIALLELLYSFGRIFKGTMVQKIFEYMKANYLAFLPILLFINAIGLSDKSAGWGATYISLYGVWIFAYLFLFAFQKRNNWCNGPAQMIMILTWFLIAFSKFNQISQGNKTTSIAPNDNTTTPEDPPQNVVQ